MRYAKYAGGRNALFAADAGIAEPAIVNKC